MEQDDQVAPERVLQRLIELLEGDEEPSSGEVSDLIDNRLSAQEQHRFFDSVIESANKISSGKSNPSLAFVSALRTKRNDDKALNRFRFAMGPWYSNVILADLCALDPNETNVEKRLEQRMQALVREALAWVPDGIFSQVVLTIQTSNPTDTEKPEVWFCSCAGDPSTQENLVKQFDELTVEYATEYGTSALQKLHLRANHYISESDISESEREKPSTRDTPFSLCWPAGSKRSTEVLHPGPILPGSLKGLHPNTAMPQPPDFLKSLQGKIQTYREKKLWLLHIASGIDFPGKDEGPSATVAHLFIVRQLKNNRSRKFRRLFKQYEDTMDVLLYKLAHFYTLERYLEEKRALNKRDQMLRLLDRPLAQITQALENMQADAQELRAVLYSPVRGLFAAAPRVWQYFEEHRTVHVGRISWIIKHQPDQYDPYAAAATIAAIVCAVFGCDISDVQSGAALYERTIELLERDWEAFKKLQHLCWLFLTQGHTDDSNKAQVRGALAWILRREVRTDEQLDNEEWADNWLGKAADGKKNKAEGMQTRILQSFKESLLDPYKESRLEKSLLPLWLVLFGEQSRPQYKIKNKIVSNWYRVFEAPREEIDLPVPQLHNLLNFLSGVCECAETGPQNRRGYPKLATLEGNARGWNLKVQFSNDVFDSLTIGKLWKAIIDTDPKKSAGQAGNFQKPFLDFTRWVSEANEGLGWMSSRNGVIYITNNLTVDIQLRNDRELVLNVCTDPTSTEGANNANLVV